jgi:hypothetical protein
MTNPVGEGVGVHIHSSESTRFGTDWVSTDEARRISVNLQVPERKLSRWKQEIQERKVEIRW